MLKFFLMLLLANSLLADDPKPKYGFGGIPAVGYVSGFGLGFGAVGSFYKKEPDVQPYRYMLDAQAYFTPGGFQSHRLRFDYIDVAGLPLRLRPMVGLLANLAENYCGQGMRANCSPEEPANYYSQPFRTRPSSP